MGSRFIQAFGNWYLISIDLILVIGIVYFLKLPNDKRANIHYWLPFLILIFPVFYENLGAYTNFNFEFKKSVNALLGNTEHPRYNVWVYNIFNQQIVTLLILFLVKSYLPIRSKRIVSWLMFFFIVMSFFIVAFELEPIYGSQPLIFSIAAGAILTSCGLYFMSFITEDGYLESNPLRLASFWQVSFILFYHSAIFLKTISQKYLWAELYDFGRSLQFINTSLWIVLMITMLLTLAAPSLKLNFENEPSHV
jgi:hypothetical protein